MSSKRKVKFKKGIFQKLFWLLSILFMLLIVLLFGIKYFINSKKYNDDMKIYEYTIKNCEITKEDDYYIFRGEEENNYIKYNNLMFRIVKIYKDGSMDIISDNSINSIYYDKDDYAFKNSSILEYLNNEFLKYIDKSYLNKSPFCDNEINSVEDINCNLNYSSYIRLLSINEYMASYLDGKSYLSTDMMWLSSYSSNFVWIGNNGSISKGNISDAYYVYPVLTLNNRVKYVSGNGTKEEPFIIEKKDYGIGSYVKIMDDMYIISDINNSTLKLTLVGDKILVRYNYSDKLLDNLNLEYYNNLEYKDVLEKFKIGTGKYNGDYDSVYENKETVYVGIPSVNDLKLDNSIEDYYLVNMYGDKSLYYNDGLKTNNDNLSYKLRTIIAIKRNKINGGFGTKEDPYIVEVK